MLSSLYLPLGLNWGVAPFSADAFSSAIVKATPLPPD